MRKQILALTLLLQLTYFMPLSYADNDNWNIYASYHNPKKAIKVGTRHFVLANGDIYVYDSEDSSVSLYDKANALSDFGIYDIAYCKSVNAIFVLYNNGNIDLLYIGNNTSCNIYELKKKYLTESTIHELNITDDKAYISTDAGIAVINIRNRYIENIYDFGKAVKSTLVSKSFIYARTASGVYSGNTSYNLLDATNWNPVSDEQLKADSEYATLKNENTSDAEALKTVENIIPDSPIRNYSYKLNMIGERLLVAGGNFNYPEVNYPGTVMQYENSKWTNFDEKSTEIYIDTLSDGRKVNTYVNIIDVVQDPKDAKHHWVSSKGNGLYEFRDYRAIKQYTCDNSPLTSILPDNPSKKNYVRISGLSYDSKGNLWMCNNQCDTIVRILTNENKWISYYYNEIAGFPTFDNIVFDSRGFAWINARRTTSISKSGFLVIDTNNTIEDQSDDEHVFISTLKNQDGKSYDPDLCYCATEDLDKTMWIGTTDGLFVLKQPSNVFNSNIVFNQVLVSRNDGSNLADYLLSGVPIKCIAIDGGNRKWIGTVSNGVYLISADGQEIIEHFTKDNSPLISDIINDIRINGKTGEVYIATDKGLCSYKGDAIDASNDFSDSNIKVFPNPVRPEYDGPVHITGLMFDSNVKIVNAAGKLISEGTSIGGEFTWNCCYANGKKCDSGIYYALCADEEGNKGASTKILIIR